MTELKAVNLAQVSEGIRKSVKPVSILWQAPDTIALVARGRAHRSEFHADPSDEVMYMIKGEMNLHYLTPEGDERDRFFWYCEKCRAELYQAVRHVADYREDPVSRVYEEFYSQESRRTCGKCGHVTPKPAG